MRPELQETGFLIRMELEQPQAEHHKGEGVAIIQAGLATDAVAQFILVGGVLQLDVRGQDWVGRRQHRAEQDARAQRALEE